MSSRAAIGICMAVAVMVTNSFGAAKRQATLIPLSGGETRRTIGADVGLSLADTCVVSQNKEIVYRIDGWVTGNELYKALLDPGKSCPGAYPFTVKAINMPMFFAGATPITVSVDIEAVDSVTIPGCKVPGVLKAISSDYGLQVPAGGGLFDIWIPLDTPFVVNGPFFAGFFIGNAIDAAAGAAVLIDTFPAQCATYNIWDTTIGFIDMCNNQFYNFPGRLAMEASGFPGGSTADPAPAISWLLPSAGDLLLGQKELWAWENSGSKIIDYVSFAYSYNSGPYIEIGRDYDGTSPLRDGVHTPVTGNGFSYQWDFSPLAEGSYTLRATAMDTLGRSASATVTVTLEPTPPIATITSPQTGQDFCSPLKVIMSTTDNNISYVELARKQAKWNYAAGLSAFNQSKVGDANGSPLDGNHAPTEFGDYYSGPVSAALLLKLWSDRGYSAPMMNGGVLLSVDSVTEKLAVNFKTRSNNGTSDELLMSGLRDYLVAKGNEFTIDARRHPDYFTLRTWCEEEQRGVLIGLGGNAGPWLAVNGFKGWQQPDGSFTVTVSNPVTGALQDLSMRLGAMGGELLYLGTWHPIDVMISIVPKAWIVSRTVFAADTDGSDGWAVTWNPTGLVEDSLYFFRSGGKDATNYRGYSTVLLRYNCSQIYVHGDFNNDAVTDISDLVLLINYIAKQGTPPAGGGTRADVNCDRYVNMSDIVYFINYLFYGSSAPCR
ncbi:MAG: hypothetical protein HY851_05215 [candidate division Zixibacteria bacterium]|nr:hypothetical protein [candidate division Zixibacteria bacterium]